MKLLSSRLTLMVLSALCFYSTTTILGQEEKKTEDIASAVKKVSESFAKSYNDADAEGLADLFMQSGEYVSLDGMVYSGKQSILAEFKAGFEAVKGKRITVVSDSVRKVAEGIVIEDGTATLFGADGSAFVSDYCAVFGREDGKWKLASLRDLKSAAATSGENLMQLEWMIGEWVSETAEGIVEHDYYWSEDGNFILGSFSATVDGKVVASGTRRIGWDAQQELIRAWTFNSEGGHTQGTWHPAKDGWMVRARGVTADGKTGTALNYYSKGKGNELVWRSTNRVVDGRQSDEIELRFVKQPPEPKTSSAETSAEKE